MDPGDDRRVVLRDIADLLPGLQGEVKGLRDEVRKDRRRIRWLYRACAVIAVAALAAIGWTAYQQTVLNGKSAAIAVLEDQNADRAAREARNAHDLCVKLTRSRAVIVGVWAKVLSGRPDGAALLAEVRAAEPLGRCPKAPAGS